MLNSAILKWLISSYSLVNKMVLWLLICKPIILMDIFWCPHLTQLKDMQIDMQQQYIHQNDIQQNGAM